MGPFDGVRVVEVAGWTFVPGAGAIMADLGADVIKVEPPTGDPQRGLRNMLNQENAGPNPFIEVPNRGKRSLVLDLSRHEGRALLLEVITRTDVFLTSYLPKVRSRLRIDVDDLRAVNDQLIYVRGSGWGVRGPMVDVGGYDSAASWHSAGTLFKVTPPDADEPIQQPPAFFDLQGSNSIAGAVAMALFQRERTGHASVIDVSLLATGMWAMSPDIVAAPFVGEIPRLDRRSPGNVLANSYRTKDGRWIGLVCLQADRFWAELCGLLGRPELADDPRFIDATVRYENRHACVEQLDAAFGERTLDEWKAILAMFTGVWAPALRFTEIHDHVQVDANGYLPEVTANDGTPFRVVAPPYQFDEHPPVPAGPAPELGQHTEEILIDVGLAWDTIAAARQAGALG